MALEKLTIVYESAPGDFDQEIEAQFNPKEISVQKSASWAEQPVAETDAAEPRFTHGNAATFNIDLFFDTYEIGKDVRTEHTAAILALTTVEGSGNMHRPPICQLMWGKLGLIFQGVLQSVTQKFTLFLEDGTPVRATLSCVFREWRSGEEDARRRSTESADVVKTRQVRRGDTLSAIAFEEYRDPALWRPIARANEIDNPLVLEPGRRLIIPALTGRGAEEG